MSGVTSDPTAHAAAEDTVLDRSWLRFLENREYDIDSLDNRDPAAIERIVWLAEHVLQPYFRSEVRGLERIPTGAALFVGNHNAGIMTPDTYLFAAGVFRAHGLDAVPYGLANETVIQLPIAHQFLVPLGAVRATHDNARRLFALGRKVLVYPGGEFDAMRPYRDRDRIVFDGHLGYVRLAVHENVPIIPVVTAGAHEIFCVLDDGRWLARLLGADTRLRVKVWPITLCIPWGLVIGPIVPCFPWRTRILIETLEPMRFDRSGEAAAADESYLRACANRVETAMRAAIERLAKERKASWRDKT